MPSKTATPRILAFVPDLMFGSKVREIVKQAAMDCDLVSHLEGVDLNTYALCVVDLTDAVDTRLESVTMALAEQPDTSARSRCKTLAFYSHIEHDVRKKALSAGLDMVVPRSRMVREGADLIAALIKE